MITLGKHRARAVEWNIGVAGTGTMQVGILFELLDLPGETIDWFGFFTDASCNRTVRSMQSCGWVGNDLNDMSGMGDKEVQLVIEEEEYDGKKRLKVKFVNSPGGLRMSRVLSPDELRVFAAEMKPKIEAILGLQSNPTRTPPPRPQPTKPQPPKVSTQGRPEPPPLTDQDIPF